MRTHNPCPPRQQPSEMLLTSSCPRARQPGEAEMVTSAQQQLAKLGHSCLLLQATSQTQYVREHLIRQRSSLLPVPLPDRQYQHQHISTFLLASAFSSETTSRSSVIPACLHHSPPSPAPPVQTCTRTEDPGSEATSCFPSSAKLQVKIIIL